MQGRVILRVGVPHCEDIRVAPAVAERDDDVVRIAPVCQPRRQIERGEPVHDGVVRPRRRREHIQVLAVEADGGVAEAAHVQHHAGE